MCRAATFGANEIREHKAGDPLFNRYMIIWFDNKIFYHSSSLGVALRPNPNARITHFYSCRASSPIQNGVVAHHFSRFDILFFFFAQLMFLHSTFVRSFISFSSPFSHVILLLTRIYSLNRSVLQFAILLSIRSSLHLFHPEIEENRWSSSVCGQQYTKSRQRHK